MSLDNRGMTVAQAKQLAADPTISPGVMVRLANGYPEVRATLLTNPALYPELRAWIENAQATAATPQAQPQSAVRPVASPVARPVQVKPVATHKPKRRRRRGLFGKLLATALPVGAFLTATWLLVSAAEAVTPERGLVLGQDIRNDPNGEYVWSYDMSVGGDSDCTDFSVKTYDQDLAVVLVQNDIAEKKCRKASNRIASTMALLNTKTGQQLWKIDFEDELEWTSKWRKEIVELPGLNEILVKFIDINGQNADGKPADGDSASGGLKLKTLVPYSKLNGRVTDPVIAGSTAQPPMKSGVIEVLPIPGDSKYVLLMTNGAKKDFRYAKYRSKKLTDENWSFESNLQPLGGTPIVDRKLILGRDKDDTPIALRIRNGKKQSWAGEAGGSIFNVGSSSIHVDGKAVTSQINNVGAQAGSKGRDTVITGIDKSGRELWRIECTGYALSRSETTSTLVSRTRYNELYTLQGSKNRTVDRIDPAGGTRIWQQVLGSDFEIARLSSPQFGAVYLTAEGDEEASKLRMFSLATGELGEPSKIPSDQVRVDGYSLRTTFLVNEPERKKATADIEDGKDVNVSNKPKKKGNRTCAKALDTRSANELWSLICNENEHIARVGGNWMLLDTTPGEERLSPLVSYRSGKF